VYKRQTLDYETRPQQTLSEKWAFFMGVATPICFPWYLATLLGAWIGTSIPANSGLDFALPIAFLAMIGPMLRTPAHRVAALAASLLALGFAWLPFNFGLILGALGGMIVGAEAERSGLGLPGFEDRQ